MNEKRSLQDLTDLLAEKHDLSKKDAEAVVKGMFDLIEEALDRDKYVKVKGLGTFKLTEVESRESVDVNTGERIEIQGHNKVSFTPDTSMKDLINKPFAHFETVILNEGIQLEDTVTETEEELAEELRNENDADAVVPGMESSVASIPADSPSADGASSETSSEISSQTSSGVSSGVSSEISSGTSSLSGVSSPTGLEASSSLTSSGASSSSEASSTVTSSSGPSPSSASAVDESPVSAAGGSAIRDQFGTVGKETEVASLTIVARKVEITSEQVTANCMSLDDGTPLKSASHDSDGPLSSESRDSSIPPVDATMADQLAQYRRWIWILAVLLLLSMVLGGYFFFLSRTGSASGTVGVETPATVLLKDARSAEGKSEERNAEGKSEERNAEDGKGKKGNSERRNSEGGKPEKLNQDSLAVFGQETPTSVIPEQVPSTEPVSGQPHRPATLKDTLEYDITGTQAQHTLREGESLIKIALKYFGNKEMWPYIVRHNADVIRDANRVPVGTRLRIPQLTPRE